MGLIELVEYCESRALQSCGQQCDDYGSLKKLADQAAKLMLSLWLMLDSEM